MTPSPNRRRWLTAFVSVAALGVCLCGMLACAAEVWLSGNTGPFGYQVVFCVRARPGALALDYNNPMISQRIIKPGLNPPCLAVPWLPSLPQGGGWQFPP